MVSNTTDTLSTTATSFTISSIQDKWVINLSKKELMPKELSLLEIGPNFAVTQPTIAVKECICTTTVAALQEGELNGACYSGHDVNRILNTYTNIPVHTNITKPDHLALEDLRKNKDHIIIIATRGVVALVVMDKTEYIT